MALKVNTNASAITALRNLQVTERAQMRSMLRLSTGLRINNAGDDPSGLVIANKMRSQVAGLEQAMENTRRDRNLMQTADAALAEVETMLDDIRQSVLLALNGGALDKDQLAAEQDSVDKALSAINRIANTTKFGSVSLLDGSTANKPTTQSNEITSLQVQNVDLADPTTSQTFRVTVVRVASQATVGVAWAVQANPSIIRVSGNLGSEDIALGSNATANQVQSAVHGVRFNTGVYTSGNFIRSIGYGSDQFVRIEQVVGTFAPVLAATSIAYGADMEAYVNGVATQAKGQSLSVNSSLITAKMDIDPEAAAGVYTFSISPKGGLRFQLNDGPGSVGTEMVGLAAVDTGSLGTRAFIPGGNLPGGAFSPGLLGGFLADLASGGGNDLATNATNGLRIVEAARDQLSDIRAFIGSFMRNVLDANESALSVHHENLSSAESDIRDLDFAAETTEFTRSQILFQSGTAVLAQANLIPQTVLALLQ